MAASLQRRTDQRLRKRTDFVRVQQTGRKLRGRLLLLMSASSVAAQTRVGLTVSRKVGNAVIRNRIKRRLRALWRLEFVATPRPAEDVVIVALPPVAAASYAVLRQEFLWLLDKAASRASRAS